MCFIFSWLMIEYSFAIFDDDEVTDDDDDDDDDIGYGYWLWGCY